MKLKSNQLDFISEVITKRLKQTKKEMQNLENNIQVMENLDNKLSENNDVNVQDMNNILYFINEVEFKGNQDVVNASQIITQLSQGIRDAQKQEVDDKDASKSD